MGGWGLSKYPHYSVCYDILLNINLDQQNNMTYCISFSCSATPIFGTVETFQKFYMWHTIGYKLELYVYYGVDLVYISVHFIAMIYVHFH